MLGPVSVTEKEGVDAMRQSDMINSIVQTEHHAQEITAEAERKRKNLDADVAAEVEKLKEQYRQEDGSQRPSSWKRSSGKNRCRSCRTGCRKRWMTSSAKKKRTTTNGCRPCSSGSLRTKGKRGDVWC